MFLLLAVSAVLLHHKSTTVVAQNLPTPSPIPTTVANSPIPGQRRTDVVNPDPTPEQKAALFRVYDVLRCSPDLCARLGTPEDICGGVDATAFCNNSIVTEIYILDPRPLLGSLGTELLALTGLTALTLSNTQMKGTITTLLGSLSRLTHLELGLNAFTGTIPTELGLLTKLEFLDLALNGLEGPVPSNFAGLTKLTFLDLSHNQLSGDVPQLSFVRQCVLAAKPDKRFAVEGNCFDNCDNETLCCEDSTWPCGDAIVAPEGASSVALVVGVVLGTLLAIAMVVVVVVVVRKSHNGAKKGDDVSVRINNSGYAAASEMADNGLPPSQVLTPQVSAKYSNPLDNATEPYNVLPGSPGQAAEPYVPWGALSPMARPMPAPPALGGAVRHPTFSDAENEYRNMHHQMNNVGQQSYPMPGSSGGLAQPYVPQQFIDQPQQHQYREDRFALGAGQSPW